MRVKFRGLAGFAAGASGPRVYAIVWWACTSKIWMAAGIEWPLVVGNVETWPLRWHHIYFFV